MLSNFPPLADRLRADIILEKNQPMACKHACFFFVLIYPGGPHGVWRKRNTGKKALWTLWSLQTNNPAQHEAIVDTCQQMQRRSPTNPLLPVVQGTGRLAQSASWVKPTKAFAIFSEMAAVATATATGANHTHGGGPGPKWAALAHAAFDREKVRSALAVITARHSNTRSTCNR